MASMMRRTVQYSNNIKRTENGEFANAFKAGTPNTTPNQIGRLPQHLLQDESFLPSRLSLEPYLPHQSVNLCFAVTFEHTEKIAPLSRPCLLDAKILNKARQLLRTGLYTYDRIWSHKPARPPFQAMRNIRHELTSCAGARAHGPRRVQETSGERCGLRGNSSIPDGEWKKLREAVRGAGLSTQPSCWLG
jgi:hypothetical protein